MNNAGGTSGEQMDDGNTIPGGLPYSRETYITLTQQNITDISQVSSDFTFSLECRDPLQPGGCHTNIAGIDVIKDGVVIFSSSLNKQIINMNVFYSI